MKSILLTLALASLPLILNSCATSGGNTVKPKASCSQGHCSLDN